MSQITQEHRPIQIGSLHIAIATCTLATAFMHLYLATQPDANLRFWFLLDGLGYLGLLIVFFLPRFAPQHHMISFLLMGYAVLTVVLGFILSQSFDILDYIPNAIEPVLAALAFYEGWRVLRVRSTNSL